MSQKARQEAQAPGEGARLSGGMEEMLRAEAALEGRQEQDVLEDALRERVLRRQGARSAVAEALRASMAEHGALYAELAR